MQASHPGVAAGSSTVAASGADASSANGAAWLGGRSGSGGLMSPRAPELHRLMDRITGWIPVRFLYINHMFSSEAKKAKMKTLAVKIN